MSERSARAIVLMAAHEAFSALARLTGGVVDEPPTHVRSLKLAELAPCLAAPIAPVTAIFAGLRGSLSGRAGLLLGTQAREEILVALLGRGESSRARIDSALLELGNIAISAATGALARGAAGVVIPSLPLLARDLATAFDVHEDDPDLDVLPVSVVPGTCRFRTQPVSLRLALRIDHPSC